MVELLQNIKFLLQVFKLNRQCSSLVALEVTNAIGLKYGKFSLWAKTLFYMEQIKVEIICFGILISYIYHCINKLESELKNWKKLEKTRTK